MIAAATPFKIMLVDDNLADIELTQETLEQAKLRINCVAASDGQHAFDQLEGYLSRGEPLPDLVLLDLNMPRLDGRGLLAKMRAREEFKAIVVVMLTSSDAEQDIVKSYKLGPTAMSTSP